MLLTAGLIKPPSAGGSSPTFIGLYAAGDSVTLASGKRYVIAGGDGSSLPGSTSIGGDSVTFRAERNYLGRSCFVGDVLTTSAHTAAFSFTSDPNGFALYDVDTRAFVTGSDFSQQGSGGPDHSTNTTAGDTFIYAGYEFGDTNHTWSSGGVTMRKGASSGDGTDYLAGDVLSCAGGTPEAFVMVDGGSGTNSCSCLYR